ncbi:MAG TPA: hypothetical protein VEK11_01840 [Thermoanaerobaculia bacterium]|nr:hypothetical protein [Thermoanaerobaculia bacterium]
MSNDIDSNLIQDIRELDPRSLSAMAGDNTDASDQRKGDTDGTDNSDSDGTDGDEPEGDTDGTDAGDSDGTDNA